MKKILGIILSVIFASILIGLGVYYSDWEAVLFSIGTTLLLVLAIGICVWLILSDD